MEKRLKARAPVRAPDTIDEKGAVIIAGIGRFGQVVNRMVRHSGVPTVVLDSDMATIENLRRFGVKGFFGDPSRPELLQAAGLSEAQVLVVAVDKPEVAVRIAVSYTHLDVYKRQAGRPATRCHADRAGHGRAAGPVGQSGRPPPRPA